MRAATAGSPSVPWEATSSRLDEFLLRVWQRKWLVISSAVLGMAMALFLSKFMTRIYQAEILLTPARTETAASSGGGSLGSQFGDVAAMFGLTLPGANTTKDVNIAYVKSRQFAANFIAQNDLMPILFANRWDVSRKQWRQGLGQHAPTKEDAVRYLDKTVMTIKEDHKTGLITLSVRWRDRQLAARWANQIVAESNAQARQRAIVEAQDSLKYLSTELEKTSIVGLEEAIYHLMEKNIQSIMLANVRRDFAFEVVDPATVPDVDHYVRPMLVVNAAAGLLIGTLCGAIAAQLLARRQRAGAVNRQEASYLKT
jgi:capsular polysaccharide biosynthesis protein